MKTAEWSCHVCRRGLGVSSERDYDFICANCVEFRDGYAQALKDVEAWLQRLAHKATTDACEAMSLQFAAEALASGAWRKP